MGFFYFVIVIIVIVVVASKNTPSAHREKSMKTITDANFTITFQQTIAKHTFFFDERKRNWVLIYPNGNKSNFFPFEIIHFVDVDRIYMVLTLKLINAPFPEVIITFEPSDRTAANELVGFINRIDTYNKNITYAPSERTIPSPSSTNSQTKRSQAKVSPPVEATSSRERTKSSIPASLLESDHQNSEKRMRAELLNDITVDLDQMRNRKTQDELTPCLDNHEDTPTHHILTLIGLQGKNIFGTDRQEIIKKSYNHLQAGQVQRAFFYKTQVDGEFAVEVMINSNQIGYVDKPHLYLFKDRFDYTYKPADLMITEEPSGEYSVKLALEKITSDIWG